MYSNSKLPYKISPARFCKPQYGNQITDEVPFCVVFSQGIKLQRETFHKTSNDNHETYCNVNIYDNIYNQKSSVTFVQDSLCMTHKTNESLITICKHHPLIIGSLLFFGLAAPILSVDILDTISKFNQIFWIKFNWQTLLHVSGFSAYEKPNR